VILSAYPGKYLTFSLGQEEYGLSISHVKEINGMIQISPVPKTPSFVKGIINLRGKIIPVIDLRLRLGMGLRDYHERTCIIVVEGSDGASSKLIGLVVDSVSEVVQLTEQDLETAVSAGCENGYIAGIGKAKGKVIMLLALDTVLDYATILRTTGG